ncbi:conserved hypothetical protein [Talaromyces stipitatus ATCC 10500]|uniref:Uncharacterized protein n=1 Tax=Talaromyces stipitatus (strain ATCC 10500 / CBS 375.48 / QM 6759 / NRRL 1006) TaxID=441959 RepID=B8MI72_TALSN|nr:conserved hypothetical protein [Talaromyces stipitatus ATCC 10500]
MTRSAPYEKSKFLGSGGSMVARLKLKEIDGRAPQGPGPRLRAAGFLGGLSAQADGNVLGRTRATLTGPASTSPWPRGLGNLVKPCRAGDRALQLLLFNEECLVGTSHQLVPITSLPFVHTARRYYRLNGSVRPSDWLRGVGNDRPEPESWSNLVI